MSTDRLAAHITGRGHRLVLVHGFTQTRHSWARLAGSLAADFEVMCIDAPGHGDSGHADADLEAGAALLAHTGGRGSYVGYSMGARLALHVAVHRPDLVERLVLIGCSPGLDDEEARRRRRMADEQLAAHLEQVGTEAFVDEWLSQPLFAGLTPATAGRLERLRNEPAHLAASLRNAGTGTQVPLWDDLSGIACPVLLLIGELDSKFRRLADRMSASLPDATLVTVRGAGHSVHMERPEATLDVLKAWLADHSPMARPIDAARP